MATQVAEKPVARPWITSKRGRRPLGWAAFLVAGLAAFATYFLVLHTENQHNVAETLINLVSAGAIFVGIRRNKPANRLGWYFIFAGFLIFGLANIPSTIGSWQTGVQPFPSIADAGYLSTEPLICVGLLLFIRQRRGLQVGGRLLDAAMIAIAMGYPIFIFLVEPNLHAVDTPLFTRLVSAAYPLADLTLIAVALIFVLGPGRKSTAYRFLIAAFLGLLASDLAFSGAIVAGWFNAGSIINAGWPLFSIFGAVATLHPSMATIDQPSTEPQRLTGVRILIVSAAAFLLTPVVHVLQMRGGSMDPWDLLGVCGILFVLISTRLYGFMKDDRAQQASLAGALEELRAAQQQRQELLKRTVESAELERRRLAADLHDGPIQRLSALPLTLEQLKGSLEPETPQTKLLDRTQRSLADEIRGLRLLMGELRPPALDERGLSAALMDQASRVCRASGITLHADLVSDQRIPQEYETVLFRVAQEALANIVKHAQATHVRISLETTTEGVRLTIADDGRGFQAGVDTRGSSGDHFGLVAMQERVEISGGHWRLRTDVGIGTVIEATIPLTEEGAA